MGVPGPRKFHLKIQTKKIKRKYWLFFCVKFVYFNSHKHYPNFPISYDSKSNQNNNRFVCSHLSVPLAMGSTTTKCQSAYVRRCRCRCWPSRCQNYKKTVRIDHRCPHTPHSRAPIDFVREHFVHISDSLGWIEWSHWHMLTSECRFDVPSAEQLDRKLIENERQTTQKKWFMMWLTQVLICPKLSASMRATNNEIGWIFTVNWISRFVRINAMLCK